MNIVSGFIFSIRLFQKNLASSLIAVFVLSAGLGLSITMFTLCRTLLWDTPQLKTEGDLFSLTWVNSSYDPSQVYRGMNALDFEYIVENNTSFEQITAYHMMTHAVHNPEGNFGVRRYPVVRTPGNFFDVLEIAPILGRTYKVGEGKEGDPSVVVISYTVWENEFAKDPNIVGKTINLDGVSHEILGVMPEKFGFPIAHDLWKPYDWFWEKPAGRESSLRIQPLVVLKKGISREQALIEMRGIAEQLRTENPDTNDRLQRMRLDNFDHIIIEDNTYNVIFSMLIGAILVLMVACANVSNILLARTGRRQFELSMRKVLGASRAEIIAQILYDAIIISTLGMFMAFIIAGWGVRAIWKIFQDNYDSLPYWWDMSIDGQTLLFGIAMLILSVLISSASVMIKSLSRYHADSLKDNSRTTSGMATGKLSKILVSIQVLFTTVLISVGVGFVMLVTEIKDRKLLIDPETVMINSIYIGAESGFDSAESVHNFYDGIREKITAIPGINDVAYAFSVMDEDRKLRELNIDGKELGTEDNPIKVTSNIVYSNYFDIFQTKASIGRLFIKTDDADSAKVVVVDQEFVNTYFPNENPIGKRIQVNQPGNDWEPQNRERDSTWTQWMTIIGVIPAIHSQKGLNAARQSGNVERFTNVYIPARQHLSRVMGIMITADNNVAQYAREVNQIIADESTKVAPFSAFETMAKRLHQIDLFITLIMQFVLIFAGVALAMASAGLYGIASFAAQQKMREYGIHMALGAGKRRIFSMVLGMVKWQIGIGIFVGIALASLLNKITEQQFPGIESSTMSNWMIYGVSVIIVLSVTSLALALPARRAANMPPKLALMSEG